MAGKMRIVIGGDFCPSRNLEKPAMLSPEDIWGNILPVLASADLRILNLECPLTRSAKAIDKTGPNLKAHPDTIRALKHASLDVVTLANNHIYDYGQDGLKETLDVCSKNGIATVGAGLDAQKASAPLFLNVGGLTLAIVNCSENEWCNAHDSRAGANPYDLIDLSRQIRHARDNADIVLLIIHGGHEHYHYPSPRMVREYRFLAEQGASAVIGHHTHCISGFEVHKGVPIFYSLGNLLFDSDTSFHGWYQGFLLNLAFKEDKKPSWKILPYSQSKPKPGIWQLPESGKDDFFRRLAEINRAIADPEKLAMHWNEFVRTKSSQYLLTAVIPWRFLARIFNKLHISMHLSKVMDLKPLHNYVRCESHRDLLLSVLSDNHPGKNK